MNPDAVLLLVAGVWIGAGPVVALVGSPPVRVSSSVTMPGVGVVARWQLAAAVTCGWLLALSWPPRVANANWLWAAAR